MAVSHAELEERGSSLSSPMVLCGHQNSLIGREHVPSSLCDRSRIFWTPVCLHGAIDQVPMAFPTWIALHFMTHKYTGKMNVLGKHIHEQGFVGNVPVAAVKYWLLLPSLTRRRGQGVPILSQSSRSKSVLSTIWSYSLTTVRCSGGSLAYLAIIVAGGPLRRGWSGTRCLDKFIASLGTAPSAIGMSMSWRAGLRSLIPR